MAVTFIVSKNKQMDGNAFTLNTTSPTYTTDPTLASRAVGTLFKSTMVVGEASTDIFGFKQGDSGVQVNFTVNGETRPLNQDETVYKYYITSANENSYTVNLITDNSVIPSIGIKIGRDNVLINKSVVKASTIWYNNPTASAQSAYDPVYFIPIFALYKNHKASGNEYYYAYGFGVDEDDTFKFTHVLEGVYTDDRFNPNDKVNLTDNSVRFMAQLINTTDPSTELATLTDRVNKIDLDLIAINKRLDKLPNDIAGYAAAAASEVSKLYIAR